MGATESSDSGFVSASLDSAPFLLRAVPGANTSPPRFAGAPFVAAKFGHSAMCATNASPDGSVGATRDGASFTLRGTMRDA